MRVQLQITLTEMEGIMESGRSVESIDEKPIKEASDTGAYTTCSHLYWETADLVNLVTKN
jgi:hypothetical protein